MKMNTIMIGLTMGLLLLALPAAASDFSLEIFGNANEDDTINMQDVTYTELIILEYKDETQLADAKYDGEIDILDVTQIELIILGREKELTFIDCDGETATIHKPLNDIVVIYYTEVAAIRAIGAKERIVGVDDIILEYSTFFPDLSKLPCVGNRNELDIEAILELEPDAVVLGTRNYYTPDLEDKLKGSGIDVVRVWVYYEDTIRPDMTKLGYIFNEKENVDKYLEWHDRCVGAVEEIVSEIPEDEKPKVFWNLPWGATETSRCTAPKGDPEHNLIVDAGGINIAADVEGGYGVSVEVEWILKQNPDVIVGPSGSIKQGYETDDKEPFEEYYNDLMATLGFDQIKAVQDGRVYTTTYIIQRSPWYPICQIYMGKWLHPDLFEDLDPEVLHQEFIDEFCPGLDFDVSEHGVFVYPPLEDS